MAAAIINATSRAAISATTVGASPLLQPSESQLALIVAATGRIERRAASRCCPTGYYTSCAGRPTTARLHFSARAASGFDSLIDVCRVDTGERREVVSGTLLEGFAWLPDGSGLVYSSSLGSTLLYPPVFNLRVIQLDGSGDRQLTFGDQSYVEPDIHASGKLLAGRITQPLGHLEDSRRRNAGREHRSRDSRDAADRSGAGAVSQS